MNRTAQLSERAPGRATDYTNCTNTAEMYWDSAGMPSHPLTTAIPQNIPIGGASTTVTNWIFDASNGYSQPANGTFNADTTRYDSIGRYSIIHIHVLVALVQVVLEVMH